MSAHLGRWKRRRKQKAKTKVEAERDETEAEKRLHSDRRKVRRRVNAVPKWTRFPYFTTDSRFGTDRVSSEK